MVAAAMLVVYNLKLRLHGKSNCFLKQARNHHSEHACINQNFKVAIKPITCELDEATPSCARMHVGQKHQQLLQDTLQALSMYCRCIDVGEHEYRLQDATACAERSAVASGMHLVSARHVLAVSSTKKCACGRTHLCALHLG